MLLNKLFSKNINFYLDKSDYNEEILYYINQNRTIFKDRINFSTQKINEIYNILEINSKPENKYYNYDIFKNNCASKVKDIIINKSEIKNNETIRNKIINNNYNSWINFGINLILSKNADKPNEFIIPKDVRNKLIESNLIVESKVLNQGKIHNNELLIKPIHIIILIFIIIFITNFYVNNEKLNKKLNNLILIIYTAIGILILYISIIFKYTYSNYNLNLILMFPILFIFLKSRIIKIIYLTILTLIILFWNIIPQKLPIELLVIILTLIIIISNKLKV